MWALETLHEPLWQRLTWTLLHFLWQGVVVAAVAATLLRAWPARGARDRYVICLSALVAMAMCPLVTFVFTEVSESTTVSRGRSESVLDVGDASDPEPRLIANATHAQAGDFAAPETQPAFGHSEAAPTLAATPPASSGLEEPVELSEPATWRAELRQVAGAIHPYALIVWIAGVLALAVRLSVSWLHVRWLAWDRRTIPADLAAKATTLGCRLGLRSPPRVRVSEKIREAIVVGLWRPLVLLPASWLTEMTPEVLEAVIAHELAHIRRWDLWVNLLQRLVEMFLFYHPAVWWLSRRVGFEREMCTDELAVGVTNKRMVYATALEQLGRMRLGQSAPQFGASVGDRKMVLLNRVRNILGLSASQKKARWWPVALMTLAVPLAIWLVSMNMITPTESQIRAEEVIDDTTARSTSEKLDKADLKRWIERANSSVQSESDAAVEALVAMGPGVAQEMIPLLKSGRTDRLGIKVLRRLAPEPSVQRILVKAIEEARDNGTPNVIHCALVALGESGNVAHVDFTATFLETRDIAAMSVLATLGGDRARDHLIGAFDIVPTERWFMLAHTLERLGDSAAVPELKKRLAQVELPPNDRFPNATVGAMTGAIAALSEEKETFTPTTHCQGQHFRYPFAPPGAPKTFSVNPVRDHYVRLPKVDPQSKAGREAIWKAMEEATEGPGFTIDGNEVVAFHGLKMAPLWPDGRPYPTTLYDWLRQTSHQVLRKLVDQEKQTGRCLIPKSGLMVTLDPAGRLYVLLLKRTSDQFTYNVTVMPQDPNMQLIPVRMDAEDLQFTRVSGCTLYDLESEAKNGSLNLSRGHLETMTSKKWQGKNEDALLVVEFASSGVSLAVPGAERFVLSEASDAWEKPEKALGLLRAAMKEEPKIPGHKIVKRDGAIFHLFPELKMGQKYAFAVKTPEGIPVAGVLEVQTVDRKAETLRIRHRFLPTAAALAAEETSEQEQQTPERREAAGAIEVLRGSRAKAAWGKTVEGLQLGLSFDLQNRPYLARETVGFKLLVRNNSAKAMTLIDFEPLMGWMPTIRDADGKRLFVNGRWDGPVSRRKQVLAPGKTLVVGGVSLRLDEPWAGPSNHPPHISLEPGKYFVSQTYRFEEDPEATFSGELTSGKLELTVAKDTPWGEAVEGVRTRLRCATRIWGSSDWAHPVFRLTVDARNDGTYRLHLPRNGETWQVEVDGVWYERVPYPGGELLDFESGQNHENLTLDLAGGWRRIPKGKEVEYARRPHGPGYIVEDDKDQYGEVLHLTRGKHRMRVAITHPPSRAGQNIAPIRTVSNPVEIEILSAHADGQAVGSRDVRIRFLGGVEKKPVEIAPAEEDTSSWGDPVRGVKMRLHAPGSRWAQSRMPELRVDFVNVNNQNLDRLAFLDENWAIELDGRLYRARRPDPGGEGKDCEFGPGTTRKNILVPLHTDYVLADGSSLEFAPGKHTVRVHFMHNETAKVNGQYAEIHLITNPLEIEIVSSDSEVLLEQLNNGTLPDDEIRKITDKVLAIQGDLKQEWDPAWGNWLEVARLQGKISDADFERYAKQSNPVWQFDAKEAMEKRSGKLGLNFSLRHVGGRVTSQTTNHGLIITHRLVELRVNDVLIDWRGNAGEWTFTAKTGHGSGIFREPREIEGIEKLIPGKHEAVLVIEGEIYEADHPKKILHRWKATLKDEIELHRLLLPRGTAVDG